MFDNTDAALSTFILKATNGQNFTCQQVENGDGDRELKNVGFPGSVAPNARDDDGDD